jgi:signal transduction histidine kinase
VAGHEEVKINLFDQSGGQQETGFICIRRKFGKGAIIMGLDAAAFRYLRFKVAVKKAIENVGQAPDTSYFVVMDQTGRILGQAGERPGQKIEQILLDNIFQGKEAMTSHNIEFEGKRLVDIIAPIRLRDGFTGLARLGLSRERADQILKKNRRNIFVTTFFMVVIAVLAMWFLYKNQNRHLAKVQEMERRIQQANRLSAMGRLAAGVAHEIRNPLNAISMATQRLQSDNLHQLTGVIRDEIRRLNQIIEEFLGLSRSQRLKFSRQDLTELLGHIALLIEEEAASKGVKIKLNPGDRACVIPMDFDKLKQAFFNIVKNAMESISEKGDIDIVITPSGRDWVSVKITDSGTGLSPEEIKQIFDFDYTTKDKGLGLGLPLAHEIIRGHGGEIHVNSRQGEGTTFEVRLPPDRK